MREILFPYRLSGKGKMAQKASNISGLFSAAALNKKYAITKKIAAHQQLSTKVRDFFGSLTTLEPLTLFAAHPAPERRNLSRTLRLGRGKTRR
jgi:hypothetical protein